MFGFLKKNDLNSKIDNSSVMTKSVFNKKTTIRKTYSKKILTDSIFKNGELAEFSSNFDVTINPSKVLQDIGMTQAELFEDMFNDDHIFSVTQMLVAGVLRHPYKIMSDSEEEIKRLTSVFKKISILNVIENMIYGKLKGMAVFELIWTFENNRYTLKDIVPLNALDFTVNSNGDLIYNKMYKVFDKKYKYKFLVYRNKPYENPFGVAEILKCYYPYVFKKAGWRFWMITTEKYSVPTLVVNFDPSDVDDAQAKADELAEAFYNIQSDAVIITNGLSDKGGITKLDVNAKADEFRTLINKAEESISKVVIGTHVLMDGTSGGSRSLAEVAANINFRFKVQTIIAEICTIMNGFLAIESELQTGDSTNKYNNEFIIPYINIQDWEKTREAITLGIPVSKKSIYCHVEKPIEDEDIFIQQEKLVISPNYDHPNFTPEVDNDTNDTRGRKTEPKKEETRS